jgi:hypothetical protein
MCPEIHNFKLSKCITVKYKNYLIQVGQSKIVKHQPIGKTRLHNLREKQTLFKVNKMSR